MAVSSGRYRHAARRPDPSWIDAIDAHGLPLDVVLSGEGFDELDRETARVVAVLTHVTAARGGHLVAEANFQPAPGVH